MTPDLLRNLLTEAEEMAERHADDRRKYLELGAYDDEMDCLKHERNTRSVIRAARKVLLRLEAGTL